MPRYEIAIIGTGPAGVSAAITAKLRGKSILLLGSADLSDKLRKAQRIQNYPGFPDCTGKELAKALKRHLNAMDIAVTQRKVTAVFSMGDYFALQTNDGEMQESAAVILAAGISAEKPYPGESALLGQGVSYCATCDAPLYRGRTAAVIAESRTAEEEAAYLSGICESVLYFPLYKQISNLPDAVRVICEKPASIAKSGQGLALRTAEQKIYPVDGVFILRESMSPGQLVPGLSMEGNAVAVDRMMQTNLPGFFACGDAAGKPYQYIKAAGEGNIAALSAVSYLAAKKTGK